MIRGEGVYLFDAEGRRYLDFSAQHSAAILGHAHPEMVEHLSAQLRRLVGVSPAFLTRERALLAERLAATMSDPAPAGGTPPPTRSPSA
ncbi:MAG: aminotransferase class III-fold pyridoxal phosphate-dependent enzyme [Limnochordaceae bacterium]|nr:aminotransferase class III-fold pyridoxal phosphate-dependent enzyme [Limnochordaceae bacterium]